MKRFPSRSGLRTDLACDCYDDMDLCLSLPPTLTRKQLETLLSGVSFADAELLELGGKSAEIDDLREDWSSQAMSPLTHIHTLEIKETIGPRLLTEYLLLSTQNSPEDNTKPNFP